jgi:iron complex transport system ATP-binding protein
VDRKSKLKIENCEFVIASKPLKHGAMFEVCILAGGKSQRMGQPKAALTLDGLRLLEWAKLAARGAGLPYRVIDHDLGESLGPISGIKTAFKTSRAKFVIFLSCDMPFVRSATLRKLARETNATFAKNNRRVGFPFLLPKNAKIQTDNLQELSRSLSAAAFELSAEESLNINTPAEFKRAQQLLAQRNRQNILDVDAMNIRRGPIEILRDASWTVRRGEHWAILGANGSGKTSLLAALTGYLSPTLGRFRVLGQEFGRSDWRDLRKHIGLVSSSVRQLMADSETALETIASGKDALIDLWSSPNLTDAKRARELLEQIGCPHLEKRVWAVLSQGERQRILIGRALMAKPQALILDEPCAGLDPAAREHFLEFIQNLAKQKNSHAIVLVTHHVEEIIPAITHILALHNGQVAAAGAKQKVLTSQLLSQIFNCQARLTKSSGRYSLRVSPARSGVM